jgi:hypothetical protein
MSQQRSEAHAIDMRKARAKGAKLLAANDPSPLTDEQRRDAALFAGPAEAFRLLDAQLEARRLAGDRAEPSASVKAQREADRAQDAELQRRPKQGYLS